MPSLHTDYILAFVTGSNVTCSFSSSYTLFETQYKCTIGADEFNYSMNPSLISGSEGQIYNFATGYLLAVAKLAKPLPTSRTTDTTILINFDK